MRIKLFNPFHGSSVGLNVKGEVLTRRQATKARKALCGVSGCVCCALNVRAQGAQVEPDFARDNQGDFITLRVSPSND